MATASGAAIAAASAAVSCRRETVYSSEKGHRFARRFLKDREEKKKAQLALQLVHQEEEEEDDSSYCKAAGRDAASALHGERDTSTDSTSSGRKGQKQQQEKSSSLQVMCNTDYGKYEKLSKKLDEEEERQKRKADEAAAAAREMLPGCSHDHSKERQIYSKSTNEKIEAAERFRQEGNIAFRDRNYGLAAVNYRKALLHFDYTFPDTEEEQQRMDAVKLPCHLNLAACKLQQQQYDDVYIECRLALEMDPENVKARYRRGLAYLQQDHFDRAKEDLVEALRRDPHNKEVRATIQLLKEKMETYKKRSVKTYQAMLLQPSGKSTRTNVNSSSLNAEQGNASSINNCSNSNSSSDSGSHCSKYSSGSGSNSVRMGCMNGASRSNEIGRETRHVELQHTELVDAKTSATTLSEETTSQIKLQKGEIDRQNTNKQAAPQPTSNAGEATVAETERAEPETAVVDARTQKNQIEEEGFAGVNGDIKAGAGAAMLGQHNASRLFAEQSTAAALAVKNHDQQLLKNCSSGAAQRETSVLESIKNSENSAVAADTSEMHTCFARANADEKIEQQPQQRLQPTQQGLQQGHQQVYAFEKDLQVEECREKKQQGQEQKQEQELQHVEEQRLHQCDNQKKQQQQQHRQRLQHKQLYFRNKQETCVQQQQVRNTPNSSSSESEDITPHKKFELLSLDSVFSRCRATAAAPHTQADAAATEAEKRTIAEKRTAQLVASGRAERKAVVEETIVAERAAAAAAALVPPMKWCFVGLVAVVSCIGGLLLSGSLLPSSSKGKLSSGIDTDSATPAADSRTPNAAITTAAAAAREDGFIMRMLLKGGIIAASFSGIACIILVFLMLYSEVSLTDAIAKRKKKTR